MKTLNLDALAKTTRTLTLGGTVYAVEEMTVENFIATTKQAQALEQKKDASFFDQMEASISMIQRTVPTCPVELLHRLSIEQLVVLVKYLRGEVPGEDAAETVVEGDEKK